MSDELNFRWAIESVFSSVSVSVRTIHLDLMPPSLFPETTRSDPAAGDTVGFGARRLFDDDRIEAKYLNTAETPIYKKSQVLYGLDLARKAMAKERQAVVVEGYTDVMAAHLSGVETAVATCGTAFGVDHIKILRRIIRDEAELTPARVVFTFDGDAAGQKAAMRAFEEDQRWASQSYVAVAPGGMDPCELRKGALPTSRTAERAR